ncbi:hypothetical protein NBRC116601_33700 [Cognatishimia sp. WU-CL00825]
MIGMRSVRRADGIFIKFRLDNVHLALGLKLALNVALIQEKTHGKT